MYAIHLDKVQKSSYFLLIFSFLECLSEKKNRKNMKVEFSKGIFEMKNRSANYGCIRKLQNEPHIH